MRSRSITILCEDDICERREASTEISDEDRIKASFTNDFGLTHKMSLIVDKNLNEERNNIVVFKQMNKRNYQLFEQWQENETYILVKAIENCIRENDFQRLNYLKKAILSLEYEKKDYSNFGEEKPCISTFEEMTTVDNETVSSSNEEILNVSKDRNCSDVVF